MDTICKSKEMCLVYFVLLTAVKAVEAETRVWENIYNSNGWTPITRDKVYNSLNEKLLPSTNVTGIRVKNAIELTHIQPILTNPESTRTFSQPRYINFNNNLVSSRIPSNFLLDSSIDGDGKNAVTLNATKNRKAKINLSDDSYAINIHTKPEKIIKQKYSIDEVQQVTPANGNQYQVIESQEQREDEEKIVSDVIKPLINEPSNYNYNIANGSVKMEANNISNEFTNKLLGILSSYNIRVNDVLPNYELSRHSNRNPPIKEYMMVPIPIRILANRFNSLNHLPFDPLLAVFLSNFGYYLPGHYGINNKYYNLYGYLASNNIHNNEPFGSYKVFADTDSSN